MTRSAITSSSPDQAPGRAPATCSSKTPAEFLRRAARKTAMPERSDRTGAPEEAGRLHRDRLPFGGRLFGHLQVARPSQPSVCADSVEFDDAEQQPDDLQHLCSWRAGRRSRPPSRCGRRRRRRTAACRARRRRQAPLRPRTRTSSPRRRRPETFPSLSCSCSCLCSCDFLVGRCDAQPSSMPFSMMTGAFCGAARNFRKSRAAAPCAAPWLIPAVCTM